MTVPVSHAVGVRPFVVNFGFMGTSSAAAMSGSIRARAVSVIAEFVSGTS